MAKVPGKGLIAGRPRYNRVLGAGAGSGVDGTAGLAGGGDAVTIFSDFNSSGLKMNSLSFGVSIAWTHICRLMPMSLR